MTCHLNLLDVLSAQKLALSAQAGAALDLGSVVLCTGYDADDVRVSLGPLHGGIELGQEKVLLLLAAAGAVGLTVPEQALQHSVGIRRSPERKWAGGRALRNATQRVKSSVSGGVASPGRP